MHGKRPAHEGHQLDPEAPVYAAYTQGQRARVEYVALCVVVSVILFMVPSLVSRSAGTTVARADLPSGELPEFFSARQRDNARNGVYEFAIVADLDKQSALKDAKKPTWRSVFLKVRCRDDAAHSSSAGPPLIRRRSPQGRLRRTGAKWSIEWDNPLDILSQHGEAGRGMELSELVYFDGALTRRRPAAPPTGACAASCPAPAPGMLLSMDDRSGIVYEIDPDVPAAYPRYILMEGEGDTNKGMKCEWATVKDGRLVVGSFGKEFTNSDGSIANYNNLWVVTIAPSGAKEHVDWSQRYDMLRRAAGCKFPGYMIHEAGAWSPFRQQWIFLPRRVSRDPYDDIKDERRGSNKALFVAEDFSSIDVKEVTVRLEQSVPLLLKPYAHPHTLSFSRARIRCLAFAQPLQPLRGFSSFKFLPGSQDTIVVALKSLEEEKLQRQTSYVTVFDLDTGDVLLPEAEVPGGLKFEGLEFLR